LLFIFIPLGFISLFLLWLSEYRVKVCIKLAFISWPLFIAFTVHPFSPNDSALPRRRMVKMFMYIFSYFVYMFCRHV
jgi:hypothetical protein